VDDESAALGPVLLTHVGGVPVEMPAALELDYGPELARARIAERVLPSRHLVDAGVPRGAQGP
jgi:hypothetical protein